MKKATVLAILVLAAGLAVAAFAGEETPWFD